MHKDDYLDSVVDEFYEEFEELNDFDHTSKRKKREAAQARREIERRIEYRHLRALDIDVDYEDLF